MTFTNVDRLAVAEILLGDASQKVKLDRICEYIVERKLESGKKAKGLPTAERLVVEVAIRKRQADLSKVDDEKFDALCHELDAAVDALIKVSDQSQEGKAANG